MALPTVRMSDEDGNIGRETIDLSEKVCGLLIDISAQESFWTTGPGQTWAESLKDNVIELNNLNEAKEVGITAYSGEIDESGASKDLLSGIPYYHIQHFYTMNGGSGRLFVMFADCSSGWEALIDMQKAAKGEISQFGVWTEKPLWKKMSTDPEAYQVQIVNELQAVASELANSYYAPASILLCANTAKVLNSDNELENTVLWSAIPSCNTLNSRYVSVMLGQDCTEEVSKMQTSLPSCTPVGCVGAALGCVSKANVAHCIGWVEQYNLSACFYDIEFGFGDSTIVNGKLTNAMRYDSLSSKQLDRIDDLGYNILIRHVGQEGVYFSGDQTCSDGDYRTIARNRTINKSRRLIRAALLPYVNSPIKVDPTSGQLSAAQITIFSNLITDILNEMVASNEISGIGEVTIPATQNILKNDVLQIRYTMIPMACAKQIEVTEGLVLHQ